MLGRQRGIQWRSDRVAMEKRYCVAHTYARVGPRDCIERATYLTRRTHKSPQSYGLKEAYYRATGTTTDAFASEIHTYVACLTHNNIQTHICALLRI